MGGELELFPSTHSSSDGAWTVGQVTRRARQLVEAGFRPLWIKGEIYNVKSYRSGHWYFSLRDAEAQVRCVMWRSDNQRLAGPPEEGTEVFVEGRATVWEERGEFRLAIKRLIPTDTGGLWELQLQKAKEALERDGLLDPSRKRPLPPFATRIGIVTSPDGAALRDIVSVLRRRWPAVELVLVPTRVQGDGAEREIRRALRLVNRLSDLDLVIVGRGGGSREDLWAFNREDVARSLAEVRVPTISAVGHETDVALTDLVADHRAPTPSAAAEAAVPDRRDAAATLEGLAGRLARTLTSRTRVGAERLARTGDRLFAGMEGQLERRRHRLAHLAGQLDALSPLRVLARGYAVARDDEGTVLRSVSQFPPGRRFRITVTDGDVGAQVDDA